MHFTFNFRFKHLPTYILFPMNHLKAVHFNVGICSIGYWTAKVILVLPRTRTIYYIKYGYGYGFILLGA